MEEVRRLEARDSLRNVRRLGSFTPLEANIVRAVLGYFDSEDESCLALRDRLPDADADFREVSLLPGALHGIVTAVCSHHGRSKGKATRLRTLGRFTYSAALRNAPEALTAPLSDAQVLALEIRVNTYEHLPAWMVRENAWEGPDTDPSRYVGSLASSPRGRELSKRRYASFHPHKADEKRVRPAAPDETAAVLESLYTMKAYCSSCKRTELFTRERLERLIRAKLAKGHHLTNEANALRLDISRLQDVNRSK